MLIEKENTIPNKSIRHINGQVITVNNKNEVKIKKWMKL